MNKTIVFILGCAVGALSMHYKKKSSYFYGYLKGQADAFEEATENLKTLDEWMEANIISQMREQSKKNKEEKRNV